MTQLRMWLSRLLLAGSQPRDRALPWLLACGAAVGLLLAGPESAWAQEFERGPGFYFAWWKLLLVFIVVVMWTAAADWVNRDAVQTGPQVDMSANTWNLVVNLVFLVGVLVALAIPTFFGTLPVLLIAYAVPVFLYIGQRNSRVVMERKVLTGAHIKTWFSNLGKPQEKDVVVKLPYEFGAPVELESLADSAQVHTVRARADTPAYLATKQLLADSLDRRSERLLLDYGASAVAARMEVDGFWHDLPPMERSDGDAILATLKRLAGLNENDRQSRQSGAFEAKYRNRKYPTVLTSQGVKTGERAVLVFERPKTDLDTLEQLGMRPKMQEQLGELLRAERGLVLFSAPSGGGLRTTWKAALNSTDRLVRDFVYIEDSGQPSEAVESVTVEQVDVAAGQTPDAVLPKILLRQPQVLVLPDLHNAETVKILCDEVLNEDRMAISRIRAKEGVESLLRVLMFKAPPDRFAKSVTGVLNQRLMRRLCDACKQPYEPPPDLLRKLGIPANRVSVLYREYQPPPPDPTQPPAKEPPKPCRKCGGIGYAGRIALFELIIVDDTMRSLLVKQPPKLDMLRAAARKAGNRSMQEEGVLLLANGVTSLPELQRVLKQ